MTLDPVPMHPVEDMLYATLDADHQVALRPVMEWFAWIASGPDLRVAAEYVGRAWVSTVFVQDFACERLGKRAQPFETMVIGGDLDGQQWRYASWADAEASHRAIVELVRLASSGGRTPEERHED